MPFQSSPLLRKPLWVVLEQETHQHHESTTVERHLSLFDLIAVGVGGTIGSGIFVLTGYIAHYYAGPATTISFFISGMAACCSGKRFRATPTSRVFSLVCCILIYSRVL